MRATAEAVGEGQLKALERSSGALEDATRKVANAETTRSAVAREELVRVTGVKSEIGQVGRTLRRGRDALGALAFLGVAAFVILIVLAMQVLAGFINAQPTRVGGVVAIAALLAIGLGVSWLFSRFLPYSEDD